MERTALMFGVSKLPHFFLLILGSRCFLLESEQVTVALVNTVNDTCSTSALFLYLMDGKAGRDRGGRKCLRANLPFSPAAAG